MHACYEGVHDVTDGGLAEDDGDDAIVACLQSSSKDICRKGGRNDDRFSGMGFLGFTHQCWKAFLPS